MRLRRLGGFDLIVVVGQTRSLAVGQCLIGCLAGWAIVELLCGDTMALGLWICCVWTQIYDATDGRCDWRRLHKWDRAVGQGENVTN